MQQRHLNRLKHHSCESPSYSASYDKLVQRPLLVSWPGGFNAHACCFGFKVSRCFARNLVVQGVGCDEWLRVSDLSNA